MPKRRTFGQTGERRDRPDSRESFVLPRAALGATFGVAEVNTPFRYYLRYLVLGTVRLETRWPRCVSVACLRIHSPPSGRRPAPIRGPARRPSGVPGEASATGQESVARTASLRPATASLAGPRSTGYAPVSFSLQLGLKLSFERRDLAGRNTVVLFEPFESLSD